jgi:hypothetical protein
MLTTVDSSRSIPCWDCLKPAQEAIDGHPYCADCIVDGVPARTRYLPGQGDKPPRTIDAGDAGTSWGTAAT